MGLEKASQLLKEATLEETLKTIKTEPEPIAKKSENSLKNTPKLNLKIQK